MHGEGAAADRASAPPGELSAGADALAPHGGWPGVLTRLTESEDLDRDTAGAALGVILAGEATPAQIAGFITALRMKGESVDELVGMVDAMLEAAAPLELPDGTIDIVGMGGAPTRRSSALNVSTMASVIAAAAGATVCKHGNRRASSTSGSFDLLDELGVNIELDGAAVARCVRHVGVGFCFARTFHPAMRFAGPVRSELGIPTVFNVLGPLSHPGRVRRQVLGVADERLLDKVAGVLAARGTERAWVVHGTGMLDELTTTGPTQVREVCGGEVETRVVEPSDVGLTQVDPAEIAGGDPSENAVIARRVLAGEHGAARDIFVLNAAAGLVVAGVVDDLVTGVERAAGAIDNGRAQATLDLLVEVSNQ